MLDSVCFPIVFLLMFILVFLASVTQKKIINFEYNHVDKDKLVRLNEERNSSKDGIFFYLLMFLFTT